MAATPDPLVAFDRRIRGLQVELERLREARDNAWGEHAGALAVSLAAGRDSAEEHDALREHVRELTRQIEDHEADLRVAGDARRQLVAASSVEEFEAAEEERAPIMVQYRTALLSIGEALRMLDSANAAAVRLADADDRLFTRLLDANKVGHLGRLPSGWPHPGPDQHFDARRAAAWITARLAEVDLSMDLCRDVDPLEEAKAARKAAMAKARREAENAAADERRAALVRNVGGTSILDLSATR